MFYNRGMRKRGPGTVLLAPRPHLWLRPKGHLQIQLGPRTQVSPPQPIWAGLERPLLTRALGGAGLYQPAAEGRHGPGAPGGKRQPNTAFRATGTVRPTVCGLRGVLDLLLSEGGGCFAGVAQARVMRKLKMWAEPTRQETKRLTRWANSRAQGAGDSGSCVPWACRGGWRRGGTYYTSGNQALGEPRPRAEGQVCGPTSVLPPFQASKAKTVRRGHPQSLGQDGRAAWFGEGKPTLPPSKVATQ